ncbi:glycine cleavage system aminomethyltransferase GcvT [Curtobacterium sp. VKM Ac-2861]|uniref:glycine cleavage system aminomethyltransferase GcvT n=1 Tax=unclassified Curtobacterium TaxID=257496 RepID=UPI0010454609|nr:MULTISPECIES: glycine cleavage system aminomethyltransferase GcvT [unclassified Curtobacterium]NQW90864.1 glycine cleavage system aminomethyltransferase GcvT [Curtobacterium sp. VKM Ac-2861]TCU86510.1 aminomethyltransferase [Curtobacterium sp. PhB191]TDW51200.1 aminomethyltransferase [Curtobacterium sp. PhB42]TDW55954.1 aminomethyltransferase [Curtobacterium sp. PhB190]TDW73224.1 aminomethyltransferase [Curtobacterium sp. PhB25]
MSPTPLRSSPLEPAHEAAGATFTDFAGYRMPVRYSSDLAEHHAVRQSAGVFDLSHMAEIGVTGPDAVVFLDHALAGSFGAMPLGRAKYSLLLAEDGGILDDLVVYRTDDDVFLVVANASNREVAVAALSARTDGFDVAVSDDSDSTALVAIQGPAAAGTLDALVVADRLQPESPLDDLGYYRALHAVFDGSEVLVARTGYTGEDGFELYSAPEVAPAIWDALLEAGADRGVVPAGLAARDTLRLEAGMPLYGHELGTDVRPAQAGLGRVVAKSGDFVGAAGVAPSDDARVLVGLVTEGRRAPRAGYDVVHDGTVVGTVTSGALSPTLGHPVAMAFVDPALATEGQVLHIDVRGTAIPSTVTAFPFYRRPQKG